MTAHGFSLRSINQSNHLDQKENFAPASKEATDKVVVAVSTLPRLMTNIYQETSSMKATQPLLFHGADISADALGREVYRKRQVQHCLRTGFDGDHGSDPATFLS